MFGSRSGFDSIEEAFEELSPNIVAIETGLSSDPFMNWRLNQLTGRTIISNSDAHSPGKLGREATLVNTNLNYKDIIGAIKTNDDRLIGTIEFFPEEGKYHFNGHKTCNVSLSPQESSKINHICPVCAKELVLGVSHRVEELADKAFDFVPENHKQVEYIVPLVEILAEVHGVGPSSKKVQENYEKLIFGISNEFELLRKVPLEEFTKTGIPRLPEAVTKMRSRDIFIEPGYDGVYGIVKIFDPRQRSYSIGQMNFFENE
jgi:PHP family Zn ribbon phosphoesterase